MPLLPDPHPSLAEALASLIAAGAGRALLLGRAGRESITAQKLLTVLIYEVPLIAGCAAIGALACGAVGLDGSPALVVIGVLANKGPALLDPIVEGLLGAFRRRP
ncbi:MULTISPECIES: hypothetical protein [Roseomonadaceae]|uniref:Holin n=1 Tax=Falsiroseomonas oleicola TaxID=2801474 RepID=A0ABS6HAS8_9PROT|nr:hypothetical protein [Roseomonas oleicola]MBU8545805.1 hypothetical protein [Roseomonas oleicola]